MKKINIILCVLSIVAVAGAALTAVRWKSCADGQDGCQVEEMPRLTEEQAEFYILPDGETAYLHGVWGIDPELNSESGALSGNPACQMRIRRDDADAPQRNEKIRKLIIGKYARMPQMTDGKVEDWQSLSEGNHSDFDYEIGYVRLKRFYPNLETVEIEGGNPYAGYKEGILYRLNENLAKPPYFHGEE